MFNVSTMRLSVSFWTRIFLHVLHKAPNALQLVDIQPDLILAFLDHLEHEPHNSVRSRKFHYQDLGDLQEAKCLPDELSPSLARFRRAP